MASVVMITMALARIWSGLAVVQDAPCDFAIEGDFVINAHFDQNNALFQLWDGLPNSANFYGLRITPYDYDPPGNQGYWFNCKDGECPRISDALDTKISDMQATSSSGQTVTLHEGSFTERFHEGHYETVHAIPWDRNRGFLDRPWWTYVKGATSYRYHFEATKLRLDPKLGKAKSLWPMDWNSGLSMSIWQNELINKLRAQLVSPQDMGKICEQGSISLKEVPFTTGSDRKTYQFAKLENVKVTCTRLGRWQCDARPSLPQNGVCQTPFDNKKKADETRTAYSFGTCTYDDARKDRSTLPTVSAEKTYEVYYLRKILYGDGDPAHQKMFEDNRWYHSAIGITETCVGNPSAREGFIIEYFAENVDERLQIPTVTADKIQFKSRGHIGWYQGENFTRDWAEKAQSPDGVQYIGTASGAVINSIMPHVQSWVAEHPNWQLFSMWQKDADSAKPIIHVEDNICHSFTEFVLTTLSQNGADFSHMQDPICRNYFPIFVGDRPSTVNIHSKSEFANAAEFYNQLGQHIEAIKNSKENEIDVFKWIVGRSGGVYVASQPATDANDEWDFHYGHVVSAQDVMLAMGYNEARMMKLPWQDNSNMQAGSKECHFRVHSAKAAQEQATLVLV